MDIQETALADEYKKITSGNVHIPFYWSATIHSGNYDHDALKVLNIDTFNDYEKKFAPEITLTAVVSAGKYTYRILPNIHQTEITLHRVPVHGTTGGYNEKLANLVAHQRYNVVVDNVNNTLLEQNTQRKLDEFALDLSDLVVVTFRLIPKATYQFRQLIVGGTYRKAKVEDVIMNLLITQSKKLDLPANEQIIGIDMVKPKDQTEREHYVIPHGTKASDAPGYVHKYCGGVYSNGFSYFLQNKYWWVWPTYDYKRFNDVPDTLTIINLPSLLYPNLEQTWRMEGKALIILSTGDTTSQDLSDTLQMTQGNSVRYTSPSTLKDKTVTTKDNKATFTRSNHNSELTTVKRHDNNRFAPVAHEQITDNNHYVLSRMTVRNGMVITTRWENSRPEKIIPGMQTRFMYLEKNTVVEKYGIVIAVNTNTYLAGQSMTANTHLSCSDITIFCERAIFDPVDKSK